MEVSARETGRVSTPHQAVIDKHKISTALSSFSRDFFTSFFSPYRVIFLILRWNLQKSGFFFLVIFRNV